MAADSPMETLREEATCSLCLDYFTAPVSLECGHNFCQACLSQFWKGLDSASSCPQCNETVQQRHLRPNRQLANVLEIAKQLSSQVAKRARWDGVCGEHQEALKLFCEEDQTLICVVCRESKAHRTHIMLPIQEAAQQYKEKFEAHLKTLREEREKLLEWKVTGEGRNQEYLKQTQAERQKIVAEFQQLRQFLEEQERLLLAQLEKLDEEIVRIQTDTVRNVSVQISHLSEQISELEGKCQKPASEFLQDVKSTGVSRFPHTAQCEKGQFQQPEAISLELKEQVSAFSQITTSLSENLRKCKESLGAFRQVTVTLDPDTAHPRLILSEDRKHVSWELTPQLLPDNPERFDSRTCVLGCEGFTSGSHCWEVEVRGARHWAVGVARDSMRRKGRISRSPKGGIWAVEQWGGQFQALSSPATPLSLSGAPSRIRVYLDCDWGQVTFIDAGTEASIFTFPPGSLPGERIRPWLWVGTGSQLRLCP
nr:zinc finger protein RFP-like [Pelodiscus sinensis]|eukprot:XP_025036313.1 zinc finger protein RFP-like [Pelodiscus sinensis]